MGFASGSGYAQETWDIVRDSIDGYKRAEVARKFYEYWKKLDADDWNPCSNLLQDTGLDEFLFYSTNLTHFAKLLLAQRLVNGGKRVYFYEKTEELGTVKMINIETTRVFINWIEYDIKDIEKGLVTFEVSE